MESSNILLLIFLLVAVKAIARYEDYDNEMCLPCENGGTLELRVLPECRCKCQQGFTGSLCGFEKRSRRLARMTDREREMFEIFQQHILRRRLQILQREVLKLKQSRRSYNSAKRLLAARWGK